MDMKGNRVTNPQVLINLGHQTSNRLSCNDTRPFRRDANTSTPSKALLLLVSLFLFLF